MSLQSSLAFRFFCVGSGLHLGNGYWKAFGTDSQLARSFTMQKFAVLVCDSWLRRIRQVWSVQLCQKIFKHARCYCKGGTLSVLSLRIGQLRVNSCPLSKFDIPVASQFGNFKLCLGQKHVKCKASKQADLSLFSEDLGNFSMRHEASQVLQVSFLFCVCRSETCQ